MPQILPHLFLLTTVLLFEVVLQVSPAQEEFHLGDSPKESPCQQILSLANQGMKIHQGLLLPAG